MRRASWLSIGVVVPLTFFLFAGCGLDPMEILRQQIQSPDIGKRREAVLELANLRDPRAVKELVDALEVDAEIRDLAAVALVRKGRDQIRRPRENPVAKEVADVMKSEHVGAEFRARAAWVLGEIGDRRAISDLQGFAGDGDPLALEARRALEKLGYKSEGAPFDLPPEVLAGRLVTLPEPPPLLEPPPA